MNSTRTWLASTALLLLSVACGGGGGSPSTPPPAPVPLLNRFPIDGVFDFAELPPSEQVDLDFRDQFGAGTLTGDVAQLRWSITNDDRHLYIALEWTDPSYNHDFHLTDGPLDFDGVQVFFDTDGNGTWDPGEDTRTVIAAAASSQYVDQHGGSGNETDTIGDGLGRLRRNGTAGTYTAELLVPLTPDIHGEDGLIDAGTRYSILLMDHLEIAAGTGNVTSVDGAPAPGSSSANWRMLPFDSMIALDHSDPPTDLGGLIAFVSTHEEPKGDIYTFEPSTGLVTRITNDPTLFKDAVSLSHDRSKIAFHAAPSADLFTMYEIYVVDVSGGGGLTQLTTNALLDGHPGWSPTDDRIAYASFRTGPASIVVMAPDGTELDVLTPPGIDDNDPDWLPDGRIVFKTDRFSTSPQVRIAVMNADGSGVQLLAPLPGTSDHDPVATDSFALFERFTKDTDFGTDVDTGFVGWDLVEAQTDGSGETTLLADGWVNWLPVLDPTGRYIAHLKTTGAYTDIQLMTRAGVALGRFVPNMARVGYLDWK